MFTHVRRRRILVAALAGAVFAALAITLASRAAAGGSDDGRIAVTHLSFTFECCHETGDVLTMRPDGSDPEQLTHSPLDMGSEDPAWSREANRIYFDSDRAGNVHIFSMNANGHDVRQVTSGKGFEFTPSVSRDGKLLAFDGTPDGSTQGIFLTGRKGGGDYATFRQLTYSPYFSTGGFDADPDISPDGTRVAFRRVVGGRPERAALMVVGTDGSGLLQLTPYTEHLDYPRWSPDGTRILYTGGDFENQQVWVIDQAGGTPTQLTHEPTKNPSFLADWSPDGRQIVFAHFLAAGFFTQLRVMNADGTDEHAIWQGADFSLDLRPAWGAPGED